MTAVDTAPVEPSAGPAGRRLPQLSRWSWYLIAAGGLLTVLALARVITGANDLTSSGTTGAALRLAVPIGMAGLGGLWAERAGVVNIGLEGQLILGTWFGAWAAYEYGAWWGVLAAVLGGALGGLLHAVATVTFGVDHIVSGVAINILGLGLTRFLSSLIFVDWPGAGATQSPDLPDITDWTVPGLSSWMSSLEKHHWFLVSDLAGVIGGVVTNLSLLTVIAVALVPLSYLVLWRTKLGLRIRACGENPVAAESLGVGVYRMKYLAVVMSGGFAGLGGAFLVMVASSYYREGQTNGRGYIGLAAMIFGNWRPGGLAAGSGLFGYTDALQLRSAEAVHAMLLVLAVGLGVLAIRAGLRRRVVTAGSAAAVGLLMLVWFLATDTVPSEIVGFTPHLTTLLVLSLAAQRLRMPAADGRVYRRGEDR